MVTVDKLKIYGFGRFNNQEFELAPGLNVVFGGNEAGKSTIHSFIEAFGSRIFPIRNWNRAMRNTGLGMARAMGVRWSTAGSKGRSR
jgi:predicted ATPase